MVKEIKNLEEFEKEVNNYNGKVIIDFWAPWCEPCKNFLPIFEETSKKFFDVKFVKINVGDQENPEISQIAEKYNVMSIPTIITIENQKETNRNLGSLSEEKLTEFINKQP